MKLSKEKIIEAALAFNNSKTFDDFKVQLDLLDVKLEDFERDYYEVARMHPVFKNMVTCNGKIDYFSAEFYMSLDPRKVLKNLGISKLLSSRFRLPVWFECDDFGIVKIMMPDSKGEMATSYSPELERDLARLGIDASKELAQTMMLELARA